MKHHKIVKELVKKYKGDKNVVGIYLLGSLAKGTATEKSDIDIEVVLKKGKKYRLLHPKLDKEIHVDLSLLREDQFIKDFTEYPYLNYATLNYKIIYDPQGILKKHLEACKKYFKENYTIRKFWETKEKNWKKAKKLGKKGTAENYFDVQRELKKSINDL